MRIITLLFFILLSLHDGNAQRDETLFTSPGVRLSGIWFGSSWNVNEFDEDYETFRGGHFGFEINKSFLIGWGAYDINFTVDQFSQGFDRYAWSDAGLCT